MQRLLIETMSRLAGVPSERQTTKLALPRVAARACLTVLMVLAALTAGATAQDANGTKTDEASPEHREALLLRNVRQITYEGRRAGEGYFSLDGRKMVFQSEREPDNPFFQIYLLDFETGDVQRVSPGYGKTTCGWIHPTNTKVLFASTHEDPQAREKQRAELAKRERGEQARYSWDFDEHFDLFEYRLADKSYHRLTSELGYDAEGSWSPDGQKILFASNRRAYAPDATDEAKKRHAMDPSRAMDLYIMNADGSDVKQLTDADGYDGGPFFSFDGREICWRRFSIDGATAEIFKMKSDGTDVRQLTNLGAMSWAPFFHPSGKYLVFATNLHGFGNFELYLVDTEGKRDPVRVTHTDGFDGLPSFAPDGKRISWTSNRTRRGQSQIFLADWNHEKAMELLGLQAKPTELNPSLAAIAARDASVATAADFRPEDVLRHVDYLCRPELKGRRTGTPGEMLATAYVAAYMDQLGLAPAGTGGSWFQPFSFTSGVNLGKGNRLWTDQRSALVFQNGRSFRRPNRLCRLWHRGPRRGRSARVRFLCASGCSRQMGNGVTVPT